MCDETHNIDFSRINFKMKSNAIKTFLNEAGEISSFAGRFFREGFLPPYEFNELLRQSFEIGYRSLPLVGITDLLWDWSLRSSRIHPWKRWNRILDAAGSFTFSRARNYSCDFRSGMRWKNRFQHWR